jgi:hypothetical protein
MTVYWVAIRIGVNMVASTRVFVCHSILLATCERGLGADPVLPELTLLQIIGSYKDGLVKKRLRTV